MEPKRLTLKVEWPLTERAMQNPAIRTATLLCVAALGTLAALFWITALTQNGPSALIAAYDPTLVTLLVMAHLPAMAGAILLWRADVGKNRPVARAALGLAMVYFSAACAVAFLGNALAASLLGMLN